MDDHCSKATTTHILGLTILFISLFFGCTKTDKEQANEQSPQLYEHWLDVDYVCDIDNGHPFVKRVKFLEGQGDINRLLAFSDSMTVGSIYEAYAIYRTGAMYDQKDSSIYYYQKALTAFSKATPFVVERYGRICNNIASEPIDAGLKRDFALKGIRALTHYDSCSYSPNLLPELHTYLSQALRAQKDIGGALRFAKAGLNYCSDNTAPYVKANLYDTYAYALLEAGKMDLAAIALDSAVTIMNSAPFLIGQDTTDLANIYDTYHILDAHQGNELNALKRDKQAFEFRKIYEHSQTKLAHSYNNLGRLYCLQGQHGRGISHLNKALQLYAADGSWTDRGTCFESLAMGTLIAGDTLLALSYLDSAIVAYHGMGGRNGVTAALDPAEMRDPLITKSELIAELQYSRPEQFDLVDLEKTLSRVDSLSDLLRYSVHAEASKRVIVRKMRSLYETIIAANLKRYQKTEQQEYLDFALRYLEKGKAEILRERRTRSLQKSPNSYLIENNAWNRLNDSINSIKVAIRNASSDVNRNNLSKKLTAFRQQEWDLLEAGYQQFPLPIFNVKKQSALQALTSSLQDEEAMLDYFMGEEQVFVTVATKDAVVLQQLSIHPEALKAVIDTFSQAVIAPGKSSWRGDAQWRSQQVKNLARSSHQLYQYLLAEIDLSEKRLNKLTIIPDGGIWKIPFAALLSDSVGANAAVTDWSFLLQQYTINYAFSTRLLLDRKMVEANGGEQVLVLAPEQEIRYDIPTPLGDTISLGPLTVVEEEIAAIDKVFSTAVLKGASITDFRSPAFDLDDYSIIHFSGHGVAYPTVPEASFLAFDLKPSGEHDLFSLADLEKRRLPVDLLVLSACQTGDGEVASSEGIISLGRAGVLAGANAVIVSYWNVTQQYKPILFGKLYEELESHSKQDEALRQAQLLVKYSDGYAQHPFYWAAFQHIGINDPLSTTRSK